MSAQVRRAAPRSFRFLATLALSTLALAGALPALAQSPASSQCPAPFFLTANLALNSNFEAPAPGVPIGQTTCWTPGQPTPPPSAANGWLMHTSNDADRVCSQLVPSTTPGPHGTSMIRFSAGGNEGGIFQAVTAPIPSSYMFSAWVFVVSGQVAMQSSAGVGGPVAWTTKTGQWEQLHVCNNSLFPADTMVIYNQDPNGGMFFVDRIEFREIPNLD